MEGSGSELGAHVFSVPPLTLDVEKPFIQSRSVAEAEEPNHPYRCVCSASTEGWLMSCNDCDGDECEEEWLSVERRCARPECTPRFLDEEKPTLLLPSQQRGCVHAAKTKESICHAQASDY